MPWFVSLCIAIAVLINAGCCTEEPKPFSYSAYAQEIEPRFTHFNNCGGWYILFPPVMHYYGLTDDYVRTLRAERFKQSLDKLKNLDPAARSIPLITHRIWVTPSEAPHEAPAFGLQNYIESVRFLKDKGDYTHYFWCLDKKAIPQTIRTLKESDVGHLIQVREIKEIAHLMQGNAYIRYLLAHKFYVASTDYIRTNLVYIFGGLYVDLPWRIKQDITPLLNNFQYLMRLLEIPGGEILDKNFFAARKRDPLIGRWLQLACNLNQLPEDIKKYTPRLRDQLEWVLGGYTSLLPALMEDGALFMPITSTIVENHHFGSWQKDKANFGNHTTEGAEASLYDA